MNMKLITVPLAFRAGIRPGTRGRNILALTEVDYIDKTTCLIYADHLESEISDALLITLPFSNVNAGTTDRIAVKATRNVGYLSLRDQASESE